MKRADILKFMVGFPPMHQFSASIIGVSNTRMKTLEKTDVVTCYRRHTMNQKRPVQYWYLTPKQHAAVQD